MCRGGFARLDRPLTQVCDSGRAGDRNKTKRREGAAGARHDHRADSRSAGVTLTFTRRLYRAVAVDPAGWGMSKQMAGPPRRRHFVPSAQETNEANRRCSHRRTRPKASGRSGDEHPEVSDPLKAGRCRRCNQREMLLTKRMSEPFPLQKGLRPLHPQAGAPCGKEKGRGGKEKRGSGCLSPAPHCPRMFAERS